MLRVWSGEEPAAPREPVGSNVQLMPSQRKLEANRANAAKSTGPKTQDGKAKSRNNAYKHGMRSRTVVIPGEDQDAYERLRNTLCEELEPMTLHEEFLVKQMADAMWRIDRLKGIETALYDQEEIDPDELDRISRWEVRMDNSYHRACKQLRAEQKERRAAQPQPPQRNAARGRWGEKAMGRAGDGATRPVSKPAILLHSIALSPYSPTSEPEGPQIAG